jgi:hypothetical protein
VTVCRFGSANVLFLRGLVNGLATACTCIVINMIRVLVNVSNWPVIMIGPGGLLLVVPHLFAVPVSVLCVGLQINK